MMQGGAAFDRAAATLRRVVPEHVFAWHRPGGVTTIKIGTFAQIMAIGGAALIVGWLGIATQSMVSGQASADAAKSVELARMQAQIVAMKSDSAALKGVVADRAAAIEKRQAFLAALLTPKHDLAQLAAMLPRAGDTDVAAMLPSPAGAAPRDTLLEPFRKLEADQLAFVAKATFAAEARLRDTQSLVRRLGLDPDRLMAASSFDSNAGTGGPYLPVRAPADAEPKFKGLFLSWKKLQAMEAALTVVPSFMPVRAVSYSSGFGVRFDPFTGVSAMHAGVDMIGHQGDPIYAAAAGTVSVAGWSGAYGNCVEVAHGKGLSTRYGHLSAILVHPGETVKQGDVIARMGSTGRSTGTHLHYEVRIDGRAVNPRPYLDASNYVLAAQRQSGSDAVGPGYAVADSTL
jgi:murein DD-endopeptidase MepM/ murein hydrolase activator NlpD